ncbi:A/G-specific adenine glycosylase [Lutibacter maritimus]|uniref:Adenine DNA glycosylase n=1 Tax=Lutibacter maritimus TaxID=593133 RepID=A0A1I6RH40_9FLAO|nr:A/G-specific adenine glycosylase [Lutibacter maritimus]SFS63985.1 A/G-specific DNA-adenine glycosylase [Lutibacter maritimus]
MKFSNVLVQWYLQNKRDLPWRQTSNPYKIWLSEIILQQTRVDQGMVYYFKFIEHFPTVFHLAKASEEEVLKLWQGLGYYSRARNLHFSAKYIVNELKGHFPSSYIQILKLKGVGDYTASAIASICYNEATAVVDGNVYRVLARYFGIATPINSTKGIKEFKLLAQKLLNPTISGTHNQAVMEFGARMCKPQNPDCEICPLNESCVALQKQIVKTLPVKEKKLTIKKRYFNYLVVQTPNNKTIIEKREKGIWINLYQFPLLESAHEIDVNQLITSEKFDKLFGKLNTSVKLFNQTMVVHKLSHQHIYTKFWIINIPNSAKFSLNWDEIKRFPVPILIDNFLNEYKSN